MREVSLREKILCQRLFGANLPGGINPIKHEVPGKVQSRTVLHIFLPLLRTRDGVDNGSECPPLGPPLVHHSECPPLGRQRHPEKENRHGQKKVRWNRNLLKIVYSFVHIHSSLSRIPWCKKQPQ